VNLAGKIFEKQFTVNSKIATRIKPALVSREIAQYGYKLGNFEDLKGVVRSVTGEIRLLSKMVLSATTSIK